MICIFKSFLFVCLFCFICIYLFSLFLFAISFLIYIYFQIVSSKEQGFTLYVEFCKLFIYFILFFIFVDL